MHFPNLGASNGPMPTTKLAGLKTYISVDFFDRAKLQTQHLLSQQSYISGHVFAMVWAFFLHWTLATTNNLFVCCRMELKRFPCWDQPLHHCPKMLIVFLLFYLLWYIYSFFIHEQVPYPCIFSRCKMRSFCCKYLQVFYIWLLS